MSKHTPGPWEHWSEGFVRHFNATDRAGRKKPYYIATVSLPGANEQLASTGAYGDYEAAKEIRTANARLIAAAPELLEALRPFANYACDEPCGCHNCKAREVISKAEGK